MILLEEEFAGQVLVEKKVDSDPKLANNLKSTVEEQTAGDPEDESILYTEMTPPQIAETVSALGTPISENTVRNWLSENDLRLHQMDKRLAGGTPTNRDEQFRNIARLKREYLNQGEPVFSIDTKAKEFLGRLYRKGRIYGTKAFDVFDHDFPSWASGVIVPHGIYDVDMNLGHINIGLSHDTSEFACDSFRWFWENLGVDRYPNATKLLFLCDSGGSNSANTYVFKYDLQRLANRIGLPIRIAHYPSYCSKYNPADRRFFPHVSRACSGMVFDSLATVKRLIGRAKTSSGLKTTVHVIRKAYETGREASQDFLEAMPIRFMRLLPKLNYAAMPQIS